MTLREGIFFVTNGNGREFLVRFVYKGDAYGLDDCLTHDEDEPMVEFYDTTFSEKNGGEFGERGQFVSRYNVSTLAKHGGLGLCLDGGNREVWSLDGASFYPVVQRCRSTQYRLSGGAQP